MKGPILIFCISLMVGTQSVWCFEWEPEEIILTSSELTEIIVENNSTEFYLSIEELEEPGLQEHYIYLWIENMACTKYKPKPDGKPDYSLPNYLKISTDSEEVTFQPWTICQNITENNTASGVSTVFENFEPTTIKITPVGDYWSNDTSTATIKVELRKKKSLELVFGNEIDQIDININPGKIYSIDMNSEHEVCSNDIDFNCTTTLTIMEMDCESGEGYLEIVRKEEDKVIVEKFCKCVYYAKSYSDVYFFESTGKMVFRSVGLSNLRLSVNLVLSSKERSWCPVDYFDCNGNGTKCIRESMKCDGRPNCPTKYHADETYNLCNDFYYHECYYYDSIPLAGFLFVFLLIVVGVGMMVVTFRCLMNLFRKPPRRTMGIVHDPMAMPPPTYVPPPTYGDAVKMRI